MKNALAIALLCLLSLSLASGQKAPKTSIVADQIKKHEQDWAQAVVEEGPRWINMKPMSHHRPDWPRYWQG
jgi:hypothetical protein